MRLIFCLSLLASLMLALPQASAVEPDEILEDPVLESRARDLSKELRCLVCQNQSIDDSNAELARDLRVIVRERLVAGDTNEQVLDYVVARYGDYVLLRPPFNTATAALWIGPFVVLLIAAFSVFVWLRRLPTAAPVQTESKTAGLSDSDQERLAALLSEDDRTAETNKR